MWLAYKKGYKAWLRLEKSLSDHSVEVYLHDTASAILSKPRGEFFFDLT